MNEINEQIVEQLVNIGRKYCDAVGGGGGLDEKEKYLVRLSNGLCFICQGTNITEKFGANTYMDLKSAPGIYCKGDLDHIDHTFKPRLLYRIMEIKKINGFNGNKGWESELDMALYNAKTNLLLGKTL